MTKHYLYQIWTHGDNGLEVEHTNDRDVAFNHAFENPAFSHCDINFGVGKQVTVRHASELEDAICDFNSQQDYAASKREPYEETMKRLSREHRNEHVLEDAHDFGFKPIDNTQHRYNSINMSITSMRHLMNTTMNQNSELYNELQQYLDFIKENLDKLQGGK